MLSCLLDQIPADEIVASVGGDGAYDTKGCHEAIAHLGAQAIIPTRKNAKPWKDQRPGAKARNAILAATRRVLFHHTSKDTAISFSIRLSGLQCCQQR